MADRAEVVPPRRGPDNRSGRYQQLYQLIRVAAPLMSLRLASSVQVFVRTMFCAKKPSSRTASGRPEDAANTGEESRPLTVSCHHHPATVGRHAQRVGARADSVPARGGQARRTPPVFSQTSMGLLRAKQS